MPREFIEVPRCINTYAQIYNPAEIEAYFSLVKHITEDEESYEKRINKHIDYYVDNVWEDSKNQDEKTQKQLSNQRRQRRFHMREWVFEGTGRSRKQVERFNFNLTMRKNQALKDNSERMKEKDAVIIKYEKKEIEIDYKSLYLQEKQTREKDKRLITELKKQLAEKDDYYKREIEIQKKIINDMRKQLAEKDKYINDLLKRSIKVNALEK
jgi:hypothetical protein